MIELAKHIEVLLLENDCVIVPGLGGFIAHYQSATFREETEEFCPPSRTIGFNPQLVLNDGLLAQSYMQTYNTDFPDATRRIEKTVAIMKEQLYQQGQVDLNNVGTLYYNMHGAYEFEPVKNGFFTPSFYGLSTFTLKPLSAEKAEEPKHLELIPKIKTTKKSHKWINNVAAIAATILLFFTLSTPVANTYVDEADCASLGTSGLFEVIRSQSAASKMMANDKSQTANAQKRQESLKPKVVKIEKVAPANAKEAPTANAEQKVQKAPVAPTVEKKEVKPEQKEAKPDNKPSEKLAASANKYAIIIASLNTLDDAKKEVSRLHQAGHANATLIESQGRYRIAIATYGNASDAYNKLKEVRKNERFASAWVFTSK